MRDYRKFEVWKKAHEFVTLLYPILNNYPREELYGITSQIRRASLSIPTNIVEGASRYSEKEFANFLNISSGSAAEVEYLLFFSLEQKFISQIDYDIMIPKLIEVRKMLNSLQNKLRKSKS